MQAVREFPVPTSVTRVKEILGLAFYYWRFIPSFASIAQPLHQLTCKGVTFKWAEATTQAFEKLKEKLTTSPVLAYPTFDRDSVLETDASITGLGAMLSQWHTLASHSLRRREITV